MKKLIIAEKPSLARTVADAIPETMERKDGYFESRNYVVSWAFGHLFALKDLDEYFGNGEKRRWTLDGLPFFPKQFLFRLKNDPKTGRTDSGVKNQFTVLQRLMESPEISGIIHCGDADREGEVIVRLILQNGKNEKPVWRLWLPEQTQETIRKSLESMKPDSYYDSLYNEGLARACIDWEFGINYTRYATIKSGTLMRVGRVITVVVKAIYDREMERRSFVPVKFLRPECEINVDGKRIRLESKKEFSFLYNIKRKGQLP